MKRFNPKIHHRRSIRLEGYDYGSEGAYFLTLCARDRQNIFGEIRNGKMILNPFGKIVKEEWLKSIEIRSNISLGEWVIMPNHFHAIIHIDQQVKGIENRTGRFKSPSQNVGAIIRGFKGAITRRIKETIHQFLDEKINNGSDIEKTENFHFNFQFCGGESYSPREESVEGESHSPKEESAEGESHSPKEESVEGESHSPKEESCKNESYSTQENKIRKNKEGMELGELQFAPTGLESGGFWIDLDKSIWQRDYYEHIIRDQGAYDNISRYIINNPSKWEEDKFHKKKN